MQSYFKYFKDKAVTILTVQTNFRFKEEQMHDYYTGIVENIDEHGIWIVHSVTKCRSYVLFQHIVSVTEEQMLYEDNPEHAKLIEEYRKEKPITAAKRAITEKPQLKESVFVNPTALAEMARKAKEAFTEDKK